MKFESADPIYQPRGIQKCNKMGGIIDVFMFSGVHICACGMWTLPDQHLTGIPT